MRMKRKTLVEERYYGIKKQKLSFISMVQERYYGIKKQKSLLRFTSVCKAWHKLIHCAEFVEAYNCQVETTPILLRKLDKERQYAFHVETQLNQVENFCFFPRSNNSGSVSKFMHFLEIEGDKGKITATNISCSGSVVASCSGLVLITSMYEAYKRGCRERSRYNFDKPLLNSKDNPGRLIVMNPMTRKFVGLPLGTLSGHFRRDLAHRNQVESYGLVFSHSKGEYKVVHLFKDKSVYIACEILSLQTRSWKAVDGPSDGLLRNLDHVPISAIGALHWLPDSYGTDYIVSMGADNERFSVTDLPKTLREHDRLVEMGGFLSFVTSLNKNQLDVWILKELEGVEWIKQHTIHVDAILGHVNNVELAVPAFALSAKEVVFRRGKRLFVYDFELEEIREVEMEEGTLTPFEYILPHSNSLATWESLEPMS